MDIGERIVIIGSPGSGKSTYARLLARLTGLPRVHLDRHYWNPGWVPTPRSEFHAWQEEIVREERWIIDGNFSSSLDIRLSRAQTVIIFKLPRLVCLMGYIKRSLTHIGRIREDMSPGCPERLNWHFMRYIWAFPWEHGLDDEKKLEQYPGLSVITFHSHAQARTFLRKMSRSAVTKEETV